MKISPYVWVGLQGSTEPTVMYIMQVVSSVTGVTVNDIAGRVRRREFAYARALLGCLARKYTSLSFETIGAAMGRDHATVMHYCREHEYRMAYDDYARPFLKCCAKIEPDVGNPEVEPDFPEQEEDKHLHFIY